MATADNAAPSYLHAVPPLPDQGGPAEKKRAKDPWWKVDGGQAAPAAPARGDDADFRTAGGPVDPATPAPATSRPDSPRPAGHAASGPRATGHGSAVAPPVQAPPAVAPQTGPGGEVELAAPGAVDLVHHWTGLARVSSARPGGLLHGITAGSPPSARGHLEYVGSRAWVPPGHPGGVISPAGAVYGYTIGLLGVTIGNGITWTFHKPTRLLLVGLVAVLLILIGIVCL